jgi:hypothetical protein
MSRQFQVVGDVMGYDDDGVQGDVMGDGEYEVIGYDHNDYPIVVGAGRRRRGRRGGGGTPVVVRRPEWRERQLAPGVQAPDEGLESLPMGNFTFALAAQTNTYSGQVQKPFQGERWLLRVVRTGTTATGIILAQLFAGTDLAQLDVTPLDLESLARPDAFGVRNAMKPVQPGVLMRAVSSLSTAIAGTDTIATSLQLLGKLIH